MKKLPIPLDGKSVKDIFLDCIENLGDKDALEQCADLIQADSKAFEELVPLHLADFQYHTDFPAGVTGERLKEVYSNTFVSRKRFYRKILFPDSLTECPICDTGELGTLDHYLPKSIVPTLAVTPCNLVPMCDKCNRIKSDQMETAPEKMPFHLYFDDFSVEPWLTVQLVLGEELAALYDVRCPDTDPIKNARIKEHLKLYNLSDRFRDRASGEMARNRRNWCRKLSRGGADGLRMDIEDLRIGAEEIDTNSWRSALYRSLEDNLDLLIQWLNASMQ